MKKERKAKQRATVSYATPAPAEPHILKEAATAFALEEEAPMVRTQIYLSRTEHQFVQHESTRQGQPMAAIIRAFIEEKMNVPETTWTANSLLAAPADPDFVGPEDGVINHDHYVYGTPRKWIKRKGQWVEAPALAADYHARANRSSDKEEESE